MSAKFGARSRRSGECTILAACCALLLAASPETQTLDDHWAPLQGLALETDIDAGLERLADWLEPAPVIGLGESEHGAFEFHLFARRFFEYLVEQRGFGIFSYEINQAHAARLDAWVQGDSDLDLDELLAQRWWVAEVFYDRDLQDLLRWMRAWNERSLRKIHIAGFDFKQPSFAIETVLSAIRRSDPTRAEKAAALYQQILGLGGFGVFPNTAGFTSTLQLELPSSEKERQLEVEMDSEIEGISHGVIGWSIAVAKSPTARTVIRARQPVPRSLHRRRLELSIRANAGPVKLDFFHRGNGRVRFSNLRLWLDGDMIPSPSFERLEQRPLLFPHLQRMDYRVSHQSAVALEVTCSRAIDQALDSLAEVASLASHVLEAGTLVSPADRAWLKQAHRLIAQSVEWRTLVENNRDVGLAENILWIREQARPGEKMIVFAHSTHTERVPRRMGAFLANALGRDYRTATLLARSGSLLELAGPGDDGVTPKLSVRVLEQQVFASSLADAVGSSTTDGFLVDRLGAPAGELPEPILGNGEADVVIVMPLVSPSRRLSPQGSRRE